MSSRPQFTPYRVVPAGDMSADFTSAVTIIQKLSLVSYAILWQGVSPEGLIVVEVSNDYSQNADGSVNNSGTWSALPFGLATTVTGDNGTGFVDVDAMAGYAMRLRYVATSGTGTMVVTVSAKVA